MNETISLVESIFYINWNDISIKKKTPIVYDSDS